MASSSVEWALSEDETDGGMCSDVPEEAMKSSSLVCSTSETEDQELASPSGSHLQAPVARKTSQSHWPGGGTGTGSGMYTGGGGGRRARTLRREGCAAASTARSAAALEAAAAIDWTGRASVGAALRSGKLESLRAALTGVAVVLLWVCAILKLVALL